MATKQRINIPEEFKAGETFTLRDVAWAFLFPFYWPAYRRTASIRNCAKIKVLSKRPNDMYDVELMEVAPEEGRIVVPLGMKNTVPLHDIQVAFVSSFKSSLT